MDEYQHMDRFDTENDYEGGQWIGNEYYCKSYKKKSHKQSKDDIIFGIFNESDSDDYDSEGQNKRKKKRKGDNLSKKPNFSKPVNFVSTGTVHPSEEIEKQTEENDLDSENPGLGLGFGLGFQNSKTMLQNDEKNETHVQNHEKNKILQQDQDHQSEIEDFLPSAFGKRIKEGVERREKEREKDKGKSKSRVNGAGNNDLGEFEKYTKGIGMKLLEKMGYRGGGLGKRGEGIAVPIEAKLRPKNMGMGFNDFNEAAAVPKLTQAEVVLKDKEIKNKSRDRLWAKVSQGKKKKEKEYVTPEEFLVQKEEQGVEVVVQKVLDMRGPQVRVLTNLENLNAEQKAIEEQIPMPELQHNVRLIVDFAESDIQKYDKSLRHERETLAIYQKEKERLQKEADRQMRQITSLQAMLSTVDQVRDSVASGTMSLENLSSVFENMRSSYWEEYKLWNLSCIAASFALPLLMKVFQGWDPLEQPFYGKDIMAPWQKLLEVDQARDYGIYTDAELGSSSVYNQLFFEVVLPHLRRAATNNWEHRDPERMIRFLELWEKVVPASSLHYILENLIMSKLTAAVNAWDPRQEQIAIHSWLHPWLPFLGQRMDPLYPIIQYKIRNVLHAWHASDVSAFTLLSPWKTVFDPLSWEQLIVASIKPKLMEALQEFQVNPANQQLDQFYWVMKWASAIPVTHMVDVLERCFFPKWHQVLYHWLSSNFDYEEITNWYLGWKQLFPAELLASEKIRGQLNMGLHMMDQAVQGMTVVQPGARENVSYLRSTEQRQFEALQQQQQQQRSQIGFKEIVEEFAQENDLMFLPKVGRFNDGMQVYSFGSVTICLDIVKQQVFALSGERWMPTSFEQLIEMNRGRPARNH